MISLRSFDTHSEYEDYMSGETMTKPNTCVCLEDDEVHYNPVPYNEQYLTFDIVSAGTIAWRVSDTAYTKTIYYSLDEGETWSGITAGPSVSFNVNAGDKVMFKGDNIVYGSPTESRINSFNGSTAYFNVYGNIMSLINSTDFPSLTATTYQYIFDALFKSTNLIDAHNLILQATNLSEHAYSNMFYNCGKLVRPPKLPAKNLGPHCYYRMFSYCTGLTVAPELPATTLVDRDGCYGWMFMSCRSLTVAPELPATTLATSCYYYMFQDCANLRIAPELPATTLKVSCYYGMFEGCTHLKIAPELPATTLAGSCYCRMFNGCTRLKITHGLPATTLADSCYERMFNNCTSLTVAPELPATTFSPRCYSFMFYGSNVLPDCTNIDFSNEDVVGDGALYGLFAGTKITDDDLNSILPKNANDEICLPVRTLSEYCYSNMFKDCTGITMAPVLPATSLPEGSYEQMFYGCSSLSYIKALFLTDNGESSPATSNWVHGVSRTGTFVKNSEATWNVSGDNGVPYGWRVITTDDEESGGDDIEPVNRYIAIDDFVPEYVDEECDGDEGDTECILAAYNDYYDFDDVDGNQCGVYLYNGEYIYDGEPCYIWEMIDGGNGYARDVAFILTSSRDFTGRTLEDGVITYPVIASLNEDLEDNYNGGGTKTRHFIIKQWDE